MVLARLWYGTPKRNYKWEFRFGLYALCSCNACVLGLKPLSQDDSQSCAVEDKQGKVMGP